MNVNAIHTSHVNNKAKVCTPDGVSEELDIVAGVLHVIHPAEGYSSTLLIYCDISSTIVDYALRKANNGQEEELSFTIVPRRSRRLYPTLLTYLDFAHDIAIILNTSTKARQLLLNVESECQKMGLCLNSKKTKVMSFNMEGTLLKTVEGQNLQVVEYFKYLGAWINSSDNDIRVRKTLS